MSHPSSSSERSLAHIESRPGDCHPAHSSDRWEMKASLAQQGAGFIQPFAGGTAMAGQAAKGNPRATRASPKAFPEVFVRD